MNHIVAGPVVVADVGREAGTAGVGDEVQPEAVFLVVVDALPDE
jgi:hypothetical protein